MRADLLHRWKFWVRRRRAGFVLHVSGLYHNFEKAWRRLRFQWHENGMYGALSFARTCIGKLQYARGRKAEDALRAKQAEQYQHWLLDQLPDQETAAAQRAERFSHRLTFVIPTWNTDPLMLKELAASLMEQTSPDWNAVFYDGASRNAETLTALREIAEKDERIEVVFGEENLGISGNTNAALRHVLTDYVAFCDHDDLLMPDAVYHMLRAAEEGADLIYSDEDKMSENSTRFYDPHCKGGYGPDTLRSGNYMCHLTVAKTALVQRVGGLRTECDGSQDHDLVLRMAMQAEKIVHVPRILYHWRMLNSSASHAGTERCVDNDLKAVQDQLDILGMKAHVYRDVMQPRIRYQIPQNAKVALLFTGTQQELQRLLKRTAYPFAEVLFAPKGQIFARVEQTRSPYIMIAAPGLVPENKQWLQEMLMYAQRSDVACVGAPMLDAAGTYLHAGYAVDVPGGALTYHANSNIWGIPYQLTDRIVRNVTGVSMAWMLIRRDVLLQLGSVDAYASDLAGAALGLRAVRAGYVNVITPYARVCVRGNVPCLIGPAPEQDIALLQSEGDIEEKYYPPLLEKERGIMCIDFPEENETNGEEAAV